MRRGLSWRILGALALVAYIVLLLVFFRFVLRNIIVMLLLVVTAGVSIYASWLALSGSGRRKRAGYALLALGMVALAAELLYTILAISSIWAAAAFVLVAVVYVLTVGWLQKKYRSAAGAQAAGGRPRAHFTKPYLIINPKAGGGRAIKAHISQLAARQGISVLLLQKGEDVENAARRAAKAGADVLGISGGDGSIGAVAKVALQHKLPMVILPGGTRCHFARDIGLQPEHIVDSLAGFHGVERQVDIGDINGRIFLNNASFGLYADIIDNPEYRGHKLDAARTVLQAIAGGEKQPYDLQFHHASKRYSQAVQILVGVNRYQTQNLFELGRREVLDAGVLQVTVVERLDDAVVRHLLAAAGTVPLTGRRNPAGIEQWDTRTFRVTSTAGTLVVGVDGEREEFTTPVHIRNLPKALRIYVPADIYMGRPTSAFSGGAVRRIRHMEGRTA